MNDNLREEQKSGAVQQSGISPAFGEDSNRYAYPASRGMSGLGVGSVICALCSFFCMITGFVAIGLGIAGLVRRRGDVLCWVGLVLAAGFMAYNIATLVQLCSGTQLQDIMSGMM